MSKQITFKQAVQAATDRLLTTKTERMYKATVYGETKDYELELEKLVDEETGCEYLEVTTWGYDYDYVTIPVTRDELVNLKMRYQLAIHLLSSVAPSNPLREVLGFTGRPGILCERRRVGVQGRARP